MAGFVDYLRMVMGWWSSGGEGPVEPDPIAGVCVHAAMVYLPGAKAGDVYLNGAQSGDVYLPGAKAGEKCC